jgi:hypothetical protein
MATLTGGAEYCINSVSFGVEWANNPQPVTVHLYTTANFPTGFPGSLTQIASATFTISSSENGTVVTAPMLADVPAGTSQLVMELFTPNGQGVGNIFFVGSNSTPETGPSFISAPSCGVTTPATTAAIGVPNMHIVFNVNGACTTCPTPTPSPTCAAVITHSTNQAITTNASSCAFPHPSPPGETQTDGHYWRAFNMATFAGGAQYSVTSVSFGIGYVNTPRPVTVRLYQNTGTGFPYGTRTELAETTVNVSSAGIVTTPLVAIVPAQTGEMVMELYVYQGSGGGQLLYVGANNAPETGPSYYSSPCTGCYSGPCTPANITTISAHLIFNIYGSCSEPIPSPTPTPSETPSPTPTSTATASATVPPTPTSTPVTINISGTVTYCSNPTFPPAPGVTLTLTGIASGSAFSDASGNYTLSAIPSGGNYTVTPSKAALAPGSAGITTVDVIGIQRHFLGIGTPLSGCRLTAADVNASNTIDTVDVIAAQRFFLGLSTGISNVGKFKFNPANRSYSTLVNNQTGQNYDTLIFGDVVSSFAQ